MQAVWGEDDVNRLHRHAQGRNERATRLQIRVHLPDQRHQRSIRVPTPTSLVQPDAHLTPLARLALHTVTGVPTQLLDAVRVKPASGNWLHAPWYGYHRGGAITVGRIIWFTRKWFKAAGYGDGTSLATWNWLQHLAHEVGHLPQAERFGQGPLGKSRYVLTFAWQYGCRAMRMKRDVHDGAPMEIEADRGRWVLVKLLGENPVDHPFVRALHNADATAVREQCEALTGRVAELTLEYARRSSAQ